MKKAPTLNYSSTASTAKVEDLDLLSKEELEALEKQYEKKLAKKTSDLNRSLDKDILINSIFAGAIDSALTQTDNYFYSIRNEEGEKEKKINAQFVIQKPPQNVSPSESKLAEFNQNLKLSIKKYNSLLKSYNEELEKNPELKKQVSRS